MSEIIKKIDFNTLKDKSIKDEQENYISIEDNSKVFSNIKIESFTVNLNGTSTIDRKQIGTNDLVNVIALGVTKMYNHIIFRDCKIDNLEIKFTYNYKVSFENCEITNLIITSYKLREAQKDIIINGGSITKFEIHDSFIDINLHINHDSPKNLEITSLTVTNSVFEKDFSFHSCSIDEIKINNCDFNSLSEFNECKFKKKFDLSEITYEGFTLFDNCIFWTKAKFEYVIFEKFASFRKSIFHKGINLDYTSGDKEIHFFGAKGLESVGSKQNTSQETYRIIKYNFEKLGNKIEANKYHVLELEQHRKDIKAKILKDLKFLPDGLISLFHWASSNHSSNYFLALFWIFIVSFCTNGFFGNTTIDFSSDGWNNLFKYINILSKIEDFNNSYVAMTLNKVSLGYLYYQFLTAVRKDTRK